MVTKQALCAAKNTALTSLTFFKKNQITELNMHLKHICGTVTKSEKGLQILEDTLIYLILMETIYAHCLWPASLKLFFFIVLLPGARQEWTCFWEDHQTLPLLLKYNAANKAKIRILLSFQGTRICNS